MRTPCKASEAAAWLIKEAWHPYPSPTSRCRASGPGSQPRAPSGKQSDLGTQTSFCPCTPSTTTQYHLEARSRTLWLCERHMRRSHHHQWLTTSTTRAMLLSHLPRKRIGGGGVKVFNEKHTDGEKSEKETILRPKRETAVNGKWSHIQRNKVKTKNGENLTSAVLITRLTCQNNPHPPFSPLCLYHYLSPLNTRWNINGVTM